MGFVTKLRGGHFALSTIWPLFFGIWLAWKGWHVVHADWDTYHELNYFWLVMLVSGVLAIGLSAALIWFIPRPRGD